jgi:hypothetical protein
MEQDLKQDILVLAGLIAQIAEAEADLEVPTETAEYAIDTALPIVAGVAGDDSDEVAMLNEARTRIHKSLEELVY